MRTILLMILALGAACGTKPNPEVCCTTADQCASIGVSGGLRPCAGGAQVCTPDGLCVASECDVNTDCPDAASPICIAHACVARCVMDADCMDPAAAKCDPDGVCVACIDHAQCMTATAPTCDASAHTCRACAADADCDSGVCLETLGECAAPSRLIVLSPSGTSNAQCDASHPCLTVADAMALITGQRDVIRIVDGKVQTGMPTIDLRNIVSVIVDGDSTAEIGPGSGSAVFKVEQGATLTLEGVTVAGAGASARATVIHNLGGEVVANECRLNHAGFNLEIGTLTLTNSVLDDLNSVETGGLLTLESNQATGFRFFLEGGDASLTRNRLGGGSVVVTGGRVTIENNLITSADSFEDAVQLSGASSGSVLRFNTMVNTSGVDNRATAIRCTANTSATSNIVAWNSSADVACAATYTLYDGFVSTAGVGNQSADVSTFFLDYTHRDFHLSAVSPALAHGDPAAPAAEDIDGNLRPNPSGSAPDVGAFEAP